MPDRRNDLDSRSRVVALEARYRRVARQLTLGFAALTLGVVLALAVVWRVALDNRDQAHDLKDVVAAQQANRIDNAQRSCEARNDEHGQLRKIIARGMASAKALKAEGTINAEQLARSLRESRLALRSFPIEPDCKAYARRIVK